MRDIAEIREELKGYAKAEGGEMFMGWPDRWWDAHTWRCENDHVSTRVLGAESLGRDACLACLSPLALTFPEDADGPLKPLPDRSVESTDEHTERA